MCKGNKTIADILINEYGFSNVNNLDNISYEITNFTDDISRVKITFREHSFAAPVYAIFDGYHMCIYGDYGAFTFNCTWKPNVLNLYYDNPWYMLEKLDGDKYEYDEEKCRKTFLDKLYTSDFFTRDLNDEQKESFAAFMKSDDDYIYSDIYSENCLYEFADDCEIIKAMLYATNDELDWHYVVWNRDDNIFNMYFDCDTFDAYTWGNKIPVRFFINLYLLSVVANMKKEKSSENPT